MRKLYPQALGLVANMFGRTSSAWSRRLRYVGIGIAYSTVVAVALLLFHRGVLPVVGWVFPSLSGRLYDLAVYGAYPTEKFASFALAGPRPNIVRWHDSCKDGLVLVSPYGDGVASDGPMILDAKGGLIWTSDQYGTVMNLRAQKWQGKEYLTFWAGSKYGTAGAGEYYMLDSSYKVVRKVHAIGREGDLHEFELTATGSALVTVYFNKQVDLRSLGRSRDGWITDSMFQEIDLETGKLLFEWKASDHFTPEQTFYEHPLAGYLEWWPFDFFHINSVQKDAAGNYLVSSRHLHAIAYINGSTGETAWVLGGGFNDFEDMSDGRASSFSWQHDAKWVSEEDHILSLLDNHSAGPLQFKKNAAFSQGMLVRLDLDNMTATHLQSYTGVNGVRAASQGSIQMLEKDHVLIGWGSAAAYTEFAADGSLLCEVHLAAEASFWWERVKSYRTYKAFSWVGTPEEPPHATISHDKIFVSFNGATTVAFWELQGLDVEGDLSEQAASPDWTSLEIIEKIGFEDFFFLGADVRRKFNSYRVAALDSERRLRKLCVIYWFGPGRMGLAEAFGSSEAKNATTGLGLEHEFIMAFLC